LCSLRSSVFFAFAPTRAFQDNRQPGLVKFNVTYSADRSQTPLDGRVLLILATIDPKRTPEREPRELVADGLDTQQIFGVDVENWKAGEDAVVDAGASRVSAQVARSSAPGNLHGAGGPHKYETFKRSDGRTVKLPMDRGEGSALESCSGNLISKPVRITIDPGKAASFEIQLNQEIPSDRAGKGHQVHQARAHSE
jgi:hypothetical protein